MARLLNLPLELFFKITNQLTIFELDNMEKSGLFELNEQGISDIIEAAFEQRRHLNINIEYVENEARLMNLLLRCGTAIRSLSFQTNTHARNEDYVKKLATLCPNIERFGKNDYSSAALSLYQVYIRNIEVSKLSEIDATYSTLDDLHFLFTPSLKSVRVFNVSEVLSLMEVFNESRPNFGTSVERLTVYTFEVNTENFLKLIEFFPNLKKINAYAPTNNYKFIFNCNTPDFKYQLHIISIYKIRLADLPYINIEGGEKFDLSSIIKCKPIRFVPQVFDQLTNLRKLHLTGSQMMADFSDYLSDTSFKSLKKLDFSQLILNAKALAKLKKIMLIERFSIRSIIQTCSLHVHSALIQLLNQFCRNVKKIDIKLYLVEHDYKTTVTLSTEELELLNGIGIDYRTKCQSMAKSF